MVSTANAMAVMVIQTVLNFRSILIPLILKAFPLSQGYLTVAGLLHGFPILRMNHSPAFTVNAMTVMVIQTVLNFRSIPTPIALNPPPLSRRFLTVAGLLRGCPMVRMGMVMVFTVNAMEAMVIPMVLNFRLIPTLIAIKATLLSRRYLMVAGLLRGSSTLGFTASAMEAMVFS